MERERWKRHSVEFKLRALERMRTEKSVVALARELGLRRAVLYEWRRAVAEGRGLEDRSGQKRRVPKPATESVEQSRKGVRRAVAKPAEGAERIRELEALVGRLTLESRFFKGALQNIEELRREREANSSAGSSGRSKR